MLQPPLGDSLAPRRNPHGKDYSRILLPLHYWKTSTQLETLQSDIGPLHHHLTTALKEHLIRQLSGDRRNIAACLLGIIGYWEQIKLSSVRWASYENKVTVLSSKRLPSLKNK